MLACNCLNVIIELENNEKVTKELLELTDEEKHDSFFEQVLQLSAGTSKKEVWHVGKLINIKKVYSDLVHSRDIGLWTISLCFNCKVQTHAIHRDKGASYVLVHSKLQNEDGINNVKSSSIFSPVYQIVINPNDIILDSAPVDTHLKKGLEKAIKDIDEVTTNYLREKQLSTEEKIKQYSDEQYQQLNDLRDKAFKDREALVRVIENAKRETNLQSPKSPKTFSHFTDTNSVNSPTRPKNVNADHQYHKDDFREDLIFNFENEDFNPTRDYNSYQNVDEDSEKEDVEEAEDVVNDAAGISILQGRAAHSGIVAKSCPMDIPVFSSLSRNRNSRGEAGEDTDEFLPNSNQKVDIAASIKALARSVHGDTIFGELPRPRFSSQI
ncbi:proline-rich Akt substrate 40 kDa isoform X3 [Rhynchophorus ferrugineus]|uniref:proline-rich Akt substrate 40 kDa isoform X3 n=1 Tax=Rhynchophorus ferrugineus TaxID=354439 RepID=UPI003FCE76F1